MTAQIADTVVLDGQSYALAGVAGQGLFDPLVHGLTPRSMHTANWRGFICGYVVRNGTLRLGHLEVGTAPWSPDADQPAPLPVLFGRPPTVEPGRAQYEDLDGPVAFTGGLLLGAGFLREHYVHMGFHPA